jgi:hypothetical protein
MPITNTYENNSFSIMCGSPSLAGTFKNKLYTDEIANDGNQKSGSGES